jgi:argininosuccinate synthase
MSPACAPPALQRQLHGGGPQVGTLLYSEAHATFEDDVVYSQKDAEGFIRLNALRLRIQKLMQAS